MQLDVWVVQLYLKDLCAVVIVENGRLRSAPEKLLQLPPPRIHGTLRQPPSWKSAWEIEITPTTPPRIHRTLRQPPSWKSAWEITPTTPPSNSPNVTTTPLLEIGLRNHSNYPPLEFTPNVEFVQLEKILRITPGKWWRKQNYWQCRDVPSNLDTGVGVRLENKKMYRTNLGDLSNCGGTNGSEIDPRFLCWFS